MVSIAKISIVVAGALVALSVGIGLFLVSGIYNIGADDHHTKVVLSLITELRDRSIARRAASLEVPNLDDSKRVVSGAEHYATLCVACHLAPGMTKSEVRVGLYPNPPNLGQEDIHDPRTTFWTIKHGIKMSAMPSWSKTLDDTAIWDLVAFIRNLPEMDDQTYQQLVGGQPMGALTGPAATDKETLAQHP
jgi:mono/diheme cytochrome c family protein